MRSSRLRETCVVLGALAFAVLPSIVFAAGDSWTGEWVNPTNLGSNVNSSSNESGPFVYEGKLYFSSNTSGNDDIYVCTRSGSEWGPPVAVADINTGGDERAPSIACVGGYPQIIFGYRPTPADDLDLISSDNAAQCGLALAAWDNCGTGQCTGLTVSDPESDDSMPWISPDGNTLLVGSTRLGGHGASDLYVSIKSGGEWGPLVNLGPMINTQSDETGPSLSADGRKLYFGSNRPGGHGGRDLYWAVKRSAGWDLWTEPRNLGSLNSTDDDTCPQESGGELYFRSTRPGPGAYGLGDLYVATRSPIPAVSEWGMVVLVMLVLAAGTVVIRRARALKAHA